MGPLLILFYIFPILAGILLYFQFSNRKSIRNAPSPPGLPILGHVLDLSSTAKILNSVEKWQKYCGGNFFINIGPFKQLFIIAEYKFLEHVLSSQKLISKAEEYEYLHPWLGFGLLTSDGMKWRKHRKMISPAFHFQILDHFVDIFEDCGQKLVEKLKAQVGKTDVDIYPYVTLCTLDIICETAMGTSLNAQDCNTCDYVNSVKEMGRIMMERYISPFKNSNFFFPLTLDYYKQKNALKILHAHTNSVISQRREQVKKLQKSKTENDENVTGIRIKKAFLDLLLEATVDGRPLTQAEIREEVDTFMFGGHDTTASAISFAMYCLANHPNIQQHVLDEQHSLFNEDKNPSIAHGDLQNMKYLELVIKETLRLYPSVPFFARVSHADLEFDGILIPKGITLGIFPYCLHRDPKYYEDPEVFNPERFESIDGKLPYAYIPFSAGPRNCIGQRFAMLEMKSTLSKIVRNFELVPAFPQHKLEIVAEGTLKSANGVKIGLKIRE